MQSVGVAGAAEVEVEGAGGGGDAEAVLKDPEVREKDRYCSGCGDPVGRTFGNVQGRMYVQEQNKSFVNRYINCR